MFPGWLVSVVEYLARLIVYQGLSVFGLIDQKVNNDELLNIWSIIDYRDKPQGAIWNSMANN
jgi:hypothetical protein